MVHVREYADVMMVDTPFIDRFEVVSVQDNTQFVKRGPPLQLLDSTIASIKAASIAG